MAISSIKSGSSSKKGEIRSTVGGNTQTTSSEQTQSGGTNRTASASFSEIFSLDSQREGEKIAILTADGTLDEQKILALQDTIHRTGELLLANPRYDTVLAYKTAVRTLLRSVIPYLHEKESMTFPRKMANGTMQQGKFTIVKKIDDTLDKAVQLALNTQVPQIQIMNSLNEIKGLIVDLFR